MILHDIDAKRFVYLIREGMPEYELREFFISQRNLLMMAGERVQNLPADLHVAVKRFSREAHAIFRSWLYKRPHDVALEPGQVVARYRAVEELGVEFSKEEQALLDRSALLLLYRDPPPDELVAFLRTPVAGASHNQRSVSWPQTDDWLGFLALCLGDTPGVDLTHPLLRTATRLLSAVDRRDKSLLRDADEFVIEAFERGLERRLAEKPKGGERIADVLGVRVHEVPIRDYDETVDYTDFAVIATRTSPRSPDHVPWFARVEGFIDKDGLFTLQRGDMACAIPSEGEVVIHKDRKLIEPPLGEARLYLVERMQSDYRAKVRVVDVLPDLIQIVHVPFPSSEGHLLRNFISEHAATSPAARAIFVTADNLCVAVQGIALNRVTRPDFDWQLNAWSHLDGYELPSGTYVLGPLPPRETMLDCAPLSTVARRLLKAASDRKELGLTKSQREALIEILGDTNFPSPALTRKRLLENLVSIDRGHDDYKELVTELMQVPQIKEDIERQAEAAIAQLLAERSSEVQKIESLKRERRGIENAIKRLETEREEKARAIKAAVRKAFTSATKREIEALGELSLLAAVLPGATATDSEEHVSRPAEQPSHLAESISPASNEPLRDVLSAFGLQEMISENVAAAISLCARSGVAIVVRGAGAGVLGTRIAAAVSKKSIRVLDVSVGVITRALQEDWLSGSDCDVLLLRYANLSDVSLYGPELLTLITQRALSATRGFPLPSLVFTGAPGAAALPWPEEVEKIALKFDLAEVERFARMSHNEVAALVHPLQRALVRRIERIAADDDYPKSAVQFVKHVIADGSSATRCDTY